MNSSFDTLPETRDNVLQVSGNIDSTQPYTELRLANGQVLRVPTSILTSASTAAEPPAHLRPSDGPSHSPAASFDTLASSPVPDTVLPGDSTVIPLVEERLQIGRRTVPTATIRLQKTVQEFQQQLDEPLAVRTYDIERVIRNQPISEPPPIRYEGATTVYPLVEEQLILTKQLILKEELRVTQRDTERRDTQVVTLRREHLTVEREPLNQAREPRS